MNLTIKNLDKSTAEIITYIAQKQGAKVINNAIETKSKVSLSENKRSNDIGLKELYKFTDEIHKIIDKRIKNEKINS